MSQKITETSNCIQDSQSVPRGSLFLGILEVTNDKKFIESGVPQLTPTHGDYREENCREFTILYKIRTIHRIPILDLIPTLLSTFDNLVEMKSFGEEVTFRMKKI